jgi:hypothetical protein
MLLVEVVRDGYLPEHAIADGCRESKDSWVEVLLELK